MKITQLLLCLLAPLCLCAQSVPVDCQHAPLLIYNDLDGTSHLYRVQIDPATGNALLDQFPMPSGSFINGIGYRLKDKMVYGCRGAQLIRIDGTGAIQTLTTLSAGSIAGDVTPDSRYLVLYLHDQLLLVDLESGNYAEKTVKLVFTDYTNVAVSTDVAFNPVTGVLYGFHAAKKRLFTVDIKTGLVTQTPFAVVDIEGGLPAMFFDSYGNLWGIGGNKGDQFLCQLDIYTGAILSKRPLVFETEGKVDGCSCPGSFNFQKLASPALVSHCGGLDYVFILSNRSGQTQHGIELEDWMPEGVQIEQIRKNPFGGTVGSGPGTDYLLLQNMSVPEGVDSVIVRVKLDEAPGGVYKNQALLKNIQLHSTTPETLVSDDPRTHATEDSTAITVTDLRATLKTDTVHLCAGDAITLDATIPAALQYTWDDGTPSAGFLAKTGGNYVVEIRTACETALDTFAVVSEFAVLDLGEDKTMQIGDTIDTDPKINSSGRIVEFTWSSGNLKSIICQHCLTTNIAPLITSSYFLHIKNEYGCTDSDQVLVRVLRSIYVPNVFSPDAASGNQLFYIQSENPLEIAAFQVFDRWGNRVFERENVQTNDIGNAWNGRFKDKDLPAGVYVWTAKIIYPDGNSEILEGDVSIVH